MPFQRRQHLVVLQGLKLASWVHRHVGQGRSPVATDAISAEVMDASLDVLLGEQPARIGTKSAAPDVVVIRARRRWLRGRRVGVETVAEIAGQAKIS